LNLRKTRIIKFISIFLKVTQYAQKCVQELPKMAMFVMNVIMFDLMQTFAIKLG
jgi:hypothetical protein